MISEIRIYTHIFLKSLKRHQRRAIVVLVLVFIGLFCLYQIGRAIFVTPNEAFVEGLVGHYRRDALPAVIGDSTSYGLTKVKSDGTATASAAVSWDVSSDGKTYIFTLNPALRWQDGTPFSAYDLNQLFDDTKRVTTTILSQTQIKFQLATPYSPFPQLLAKPLYKGTDLIGLGKYRISAIDQIGDYVSSVAIKPVNGNGQEIVFRFYPTTQDMATAYKLGELKAMTGVFPPTIMPQWNTVSQYQKVDHKEQVTLFFNLRDQQFADKTLRQALSYAVQKDDMPGEIAISPIPPTSWAFNPDIKQYVYDVNHAKDLLNKANIPTNATIVLSTSQTTADVAQMIAASWKKLGFHVTVSTYTEIPKEYQAMLVVEEIPADPDQYALWHSLAKDTNIAGYSQPRVDKLLEDGRTLQDQNQRRQKYNDFQRFLVEDDPALFLYYPDETLLMNKRFDSSFFRQLNGF